MYLKLGLVGMAGKMHVSEISYTCFQGRKVVYYFEWTEIEVVVTLFELLPAHLF